MEAIRSKNSGDQTIIDHGILIFEYRKRTENIVISLL